MSSEFFNKDVIYVNSANRTSGTSSDFIFDMSNQTKIPNDYDTITLLNFTCPKSYYLINNTNNTFIVNETGVNHTITIPNGNYSFSTLSTQLSDSLNNISSGLSWTYGVSTNTSTGKFTFTVSGNSGQPTFDFSDSELFSIVGFEQSAYTFSANVLTSVNIVNFQLTNSILLCCDMVRGNILSTIVPNSQDFSYISYQEQNPNFASHPLSIQNNIQTRFYLLDGNNGSNINLNGLSFSFTIVLYKKNDYYSHMLEDRRIELSLKNIEEEINKKKAILEG